MSTLLILAVLVLGVTAVIRLSRLYELTTTLRGKREEVITERDNRMNARFMYIFLVAYFAFFLWLTLAYKDEMLPVSASEHGVWVDQLFDVNWAILIVAFVITNVLLFVFAARYYQRPGRKAYYYPHNNKWELAWTIVPSIVLIGIIIYGLTVWNRITEPAQAGTPQVEIYGKQFDWTLRYPGPDGVLGATDYRLINDNNPLGIVTKESIAQRVGELEGDVQATKERIEKERDFLPASKLDELADHLAHLQRTLERIVNLRTIMDQDIATRGAESPYLHGADDLVVKEFHLPVGQEVDLLIRSRDIIHSVYMPHMRAQMNAVPGMTTHLRMTPTITTDSMRTITGDPEFNYMVLCNKICGASHYGMKTELTVEPAGDYKAWLAGQKGFQTPAEPSAPTGDSATMAIPDTIQAKAGVSPAPPASNEPKTH